MWDEVFAYFIGTDGGANLVQAELCLLLTLRCYVTRGRVQTENGGDFNELLVTKHSTGAALASVCSPLCFLLSLVVCVPPHYAGPHFQLAF